MSAAIPGGRYLVLPFHPFVEPQQALADADHIAGLERCLAFDLLVVDVRPAGRRQILEPISAGLQNDVGMRLFDVHVAEQGDVGPLGSANRGLFFQDEHFAARPKAGFDLDPGLLQDNLCETNKQPDASADGDETVGSRTPEPVWILARKDEAADDVHDQGDDTAEKAADRAADDALGEFLE